MMMAVNGGSARVKMVGSGGGGGKNEKDEVPAMPARRVLLMLGCMCIKAPSASVRTMMSYAQKSCCSLTVLSNAVS